MLEPHSRLLLRDALRPPPGYALDRAVTTTFSLDLMALLTIPVSFTVFQLRDHDGPPAVDPLALLEALRRHARRLTVFCQAGQIHVPQKVQLLLGYLEDSVHQVQAPRGGVFHPKLTILRYALESVAADDGAQLPSTVYRVLCSSRNLTFDRSWDTLLALEGPLAAHRNKAYARNRPLSRFVAALPDLGIHPMAATTAAEVRTMADELLRVDFELPQGFEELSFCPLGIDGVADPVASDWPILRHRRTLAMAPFVDSGFIRRFKESNQALGLISREEKLDELPLSVIGQLFDSWYLHTSAEPPTDGQDGIADETSKEETDSISDRVDTPVHLSPAIQLHGLHAKLFVADDGWNAHVYTGSANATTAAFERNVEFLVRLTGKKSKFGIDQFLERGSESQGRDRKLTFGDMLIKYQRDSTPTVDQTQKALERLLDDARYALAGAKITAQVETVAGLSPDAPARFHVTLIRPADGPCSLPAGITVSCHPLTLKLGNAVDVTSPLNSPVATFESLSFESLTSFYAFRLVARLEDAELSAAFVLNVPLIGAPADRPGRLLLALLKNREQLMRYLLMLLADDEDAARRLATGFGAEGRNGRTDTTAYGLPLLEPLLQALDRQPGRLDQIARLVEDLRKTPEGCKLVSDEFLAVWEPIWTVKEGLGDE